MKDKQEFKKIIRFILTITLPMLFLACVWTYPGAKQGFAAIAYFSIVTNCFVISINSWYQEELSNSEFTIEKLKEQIEELKSKR